MNEHANYRFDEAAHYTATVLATGVLLWSVIIFAWVARNVVINGAFDGAGAALIALFLMPCVVALLIYLGAAGRNRGMAAWSAFGYTASIAEPGLMGILYVPAIAAGWLTALLLFCDRRPVPRDGLPLRVPPYRGYRMY